MREVNLETIEKMLRELAVMIKATAGFGNMISLKLLALTHIITTNKVV